MIEDEYRRTLRKGLRRHAATIPIWAVRTVVEIFRGGALVPVALGLDAVLILLHRRANRIVERRYWDQLGRHDSWTKLLYFPEVFCWYLVVRDALMGVMQLRQWLN